MAVFTFTEKLVSQNCISCGVLFAVPEEFDSERKQNHKTFYCPNGHSMIYSGKSDAEKLRDQLAAKDRELLAAKSRADREREWRVNAENTASAAVRQRNAYKGVTTRMKNKVSKGVCPCCSHKFKNLETHMRVEHPNWSPDKEAAAREATA